MAALVIMRGPLGTVLDAAQRTAGAACDISLVREQTARPAGGCTGMCTEAALMTSWYCFGSNTEQTGQLTLLRIAVEFRDAAIEAACVSSARSFLAGTCKPCGPRTQGAQRR